MEYVKDCYVLNQLSYALLVYVCLCICMNVYMYEVMIECIYVDMYATISLSSTYHSLSFYFSHPLSLFISHA